jgi:hypothetical protein
MDDEERTSLDPLRQLMFVASNEQFVHADLAGKIGALNALLTDFGKRMNEEMRAKWKDRLAEAMSDCSGNRYGLAVETQKLCTAALRTLGGRFYEVVENDHVTAAAHYEEAANAMDFVPNELRKQVVGKMLSMKQYQNIVDTNSAFYLKLLPVYLWDWAGDSYCRVNNKMEDARRCYEQGLEALRLVEAEGAEVEQWETCLAHLKISLANLLLAHFDEWGKARALYEDTADVIFFKREKKENEEYRGICTIITADAADFEESDWAPHVEIPAAQKYRDRLIKLKAELGQRALDVLRKEFEKSEEGFPVPETYYLVAFLGELYLELKKYEKCAEIVGKGESFDDGFFEWTIDELKQHVDWAYAFVLHTCNEYFAKGLLQRPDYKEILEHHKAIREQLKRVDKKVEEGQQKLEGGQIGLKVILERELPKMSGGATVDKVQTKLFEKNPWLKNALNPGSVVNAEILYEQLSKYNWGEVVMGYGNAVEEELKQCLYKDYLYYRSSISVDDYEVESQRQKERWAVPQFIAKMGKTPGGHTVWEHFVKTRYPEHGVFLSKELPRLLDELTVLRNKAAHGKMVNPGDAENARKIVMGTSAKPGLLERLVALRQSSSGEKAS